MSSEDCSNCDEPNEFKVTKRTVGEPSKAVQQTMLANPLQIRSAHSSKPPNRLLILALRPYPRRLPVHA